MCNTQKNNTFPVADPAEQKNDPSGKENIKMLVAQVKESDQNAFSKLLKQFSPLINSLINSYKGKVPDADIEEMSGEAAVGLYKAALGYDAEQDDVEFGLYAKICIKNRLATTYHAVRQRSKLCIVPFEAGYGDDGENEADEISSIPCDDDPIRYVIEQESLRILHDRIYSVLSPYENRIWWMYVAGMSVHEICSRLESEEQRSRAGAENSELEKSVSNALYRIRRKLRKELERDG